MVFHNVVHDYKQTGTFLHANLRIFEGRRFCKIVAIGEFTFSKEDEPRIVGIGRMRESI